MRPITNGEEMFERPHLGPEKGSAWLSGLPYPVGFLSVEADAVLGFLVEAFRSERFIGLQLRIICGLYVVVQGVGVVLGSMMEDQVEKHWDNEIETALGFEL